MAPNIFIPYQCAVDGFTASLTPQMFTPGDSISASSGTSNIARRAYFDINEVGAAVSTRKWTDIGSAFFPSGWTGKEIIGRAWAPKSIPVAVFELF